MTACRDIDDAKYGAAPEESSKESSDESSDESWVTENSDNSSSGDQEAASEVIEYNPEPMHNLAEKLTHRPLEHSKPYENWIQEASNKIVELSNNSSGAWTAVQRSGNDSSLNAQFREIHEEALGLRQDLWRSRFLELNDFYQWYTNKWLNMYMPNRVLGNHNAYFTIIEGFDYHMLWMWDPLRILFMG